MTLKSVLPLIILWFYHSLTINLCVFCFSMKLNDVKNQCLITQIYISFIDLLLLLNEQKLVKAMYAIHYLNCSMIIDTTRYLISYHGSYCNDESYIIMWWLTGLLETFQNNNALLDQIQKCLEAYLESKRVLFARWVHLSLHFYHLSIQILTSFTFCSHWFISLKSFKRRK